MTQGPDEWAYPDSEQFEWATRLVRKLYNTCRRPDDLFGGLRNGGSASPFSRDSAVSLPHFGSRALDIWLGGWGVPDM